MRESDIVVGGAKIGLTEHQIAYLLNKPVEYIERKYSGLIKGHLPPDYMQRRWKRYYRVFAGEKIKGDYAERRKNPAFRITCSIRSQIVYHVKRQRKKKTRKTFPALGYTVAELMAHLEAQFVDGMNWDNYGSVWHIDHKRPASWYSFESMDDQAFKECWGLDNLQPMFAFDNISKGNRWEG